MQEQAVLVALGKLEERSTERQGVVELREQLDRYPGDVATLVDLIVKNLRRSSLGVVAFCECVRMFAECCEALPISTKSLISRASMPSGSPEAIRNNL